MNAAQITRLERALKHLEAGPDRAEAQLRAHDDACPVCQRGAACAALAALEARYSWSVGLASYWLDRLFEGGNCG